MILTDDMMAMSHSSMNNTPRQRVKGKRQRTITWTENRLKCAGWAVFVIMLCIMGAYKLGHHNGHEKAVNAAKPEFWSNHGGKITAFSKFLIFISILILFFLPWCELRVRHCRSS